MTRTDLAELLPDLRAHAGTATRLHPTPGTPAVTDSSIGGPLLWPATEPWPVCPAEHETVGDPRRPDGERLRRRTLAAAWARTRLGEQLQLTDEERAALREADEPPPPGGQPAWLLAVAQLYRKDVPGFLGPPDADVLQVLWCPLDHLPLYLPEVTLRWRRSADVVDVLTDVPEPAVMESGYYLPDPCVLHPEQVAEYPYRDLLPGDLAHRVREWDNDRPSGQSYGDLAIARGWKMGGFADWSLTDPQPMICECGSDMRLLLAAGGDDRDPTSVQIGRGYTLWIFYCPRSFDHPHRTTMQ